MKKLLLAIVLVLAMAIPAFAQNGPVKIKPLMIWTQNQNGTPSANFSISTGNRVGLYILYEVKGTGRYKERVEIRDSAGVLTHKFTNENGADFPTFVYISGGTGIPIEFFEKPGYYTLKQIYRDVATGYTWSHQTKIHVLAY